MCKVESGYLKPMGWCGVMCSCNGFLATVRQQVFFGYLLTSVNAMHLVCLKLSWYK